MRTNTYKRFRLLSRINKHIIHYKYCLRSPFLQVQIHHLDILSTHDVPNYTYLHTNTPLTTPHNTHTHTHTLTYKITTFIPNLTYPDKLKHLGKKTKPLLALQVYCTFALATVQYVQIPPCTDRYIRVQVRVQVVYEYEYRYSVQVRDLDRDFRLRLLVLGIQYEYGAY